jgi:hypothetical protein
VKSRAFQINLSSHPGRHVAVIHAGFAVLSLLFIVLIAWDWQEVKNMREQARSVEQAIQRVREQDQRLQSEAKIEKMDLSDAVLQKLPRDVAFANQVIARRAFSWTHFLHDLEDAVPAGVAIHKIKIDVNTSAIALSGATLGLKELTAFIISLEEHTAFKQAVLGQHHVQDNGEVEFALTVRYQRSAGGV